MSTQADASIVRAGASPDGASHATTPATASPNAASPTQQKQLSEFEKGKIRFANEQGWEYQRIADYIGRPKSSVQYFVKRYIERGPHENEKSTGRPKKIPEDAEKVILDLIEGDRSIAKMTLMQIVP